MSTPNADHALDLHEGGGTSTPHGEFTPVTRGGPYIATADGTVAHAGWAESAIDDELLRQVVEQADRVRGLPGGYRRVGNAFLASEPMVQLFSVWTAVVAAQRDQYADQWEEAVTSSREAWGHAKDSDRAAETLQAEVQRLRDEIAAVTVELIPDVPAEFIDVHGLAAGVTRLIRERDEARAEATRLRTREGDLEVWLQRIAEAFDMGTDDLTDEEVVSNLEELRSHRDDLALRVDQQNDELSRLRTADPSNTKACIAHDVVDALNGYGIAGDDTAGAGWRWVGKAVRELLADADRLRAAQQLPDVGPVTRDWDEKGYPSVDGLVFRMEPNGGFRRQAARCLAIAAFLEAETAATRNEQWPNAVAYELRDVLPGLTDRFGSAGVKSAIDLLDAHRARGGQG